MNNKAIAKQLVRLASKLLQAADPAWLPKHYSELGQGWTRKAKELDTLWGGDYREEHWTDGTNWVTVAISNEYGFEDIHPGKLPMGQLLAEIERNN